MNPYVAGGYGVTLVTLAAYALHILHRGRTLSRDPASSGTVPSDPVSSGGGAAAPTPGQQRP